MNRLIITFLAFFPLICMAMNIDDFKQPYHAGTEMKGNPNFIGTAWLHPLSHEKELNVPMFNVAFEPGCRNNWHRHSGGQILIATAGVGYYQEKGKPARRLFPGDIVEIAPGVEHWHGAAPDSWFAHLAIECNPENNEIKELLIQVYAYCGFPRSLTALGVFKNLLSERTAKGITNPEGESASVVSDIDKYGQGAKTLSELSGVPVDAPAPWYEDFAPGINRFLKEHLFADIFGRGVLPYTDREIATVSMLTAVGGVEPMATGHIAICRHLGVTTHQLNSLLDILEYNIGPSKTESIRKIVNR